MLNNSPLCLKRTLFGLSAGFLIGWIFVAYWFGGGINSMALIHDAAGALLGALGGIISAFISCSRSGRIFMVDEDTVIVDVREREEYEAGHIPNSISIPLAEISQSDLAFLNGKKMIVYCTSGIRSAKAARLLRKKGIKDVIDFSGGIKVWLKSGGRLDFELNNNTGGSYV